MAGSVIHDSRRGLRSILTASPAGSIRAARAAFGEVSWDRSYRIRLHATDTLAITISVTAAYFLR
jgi:hypothetical protein